MITPPSISEQMRHEKEALTMLAQQRSRFSNNRSDSNLAIILRPVLEQFNGRLSGNISQEISILFGIESRKISTLASVFRRSQFFYEAIVKSKCTILEAYLSSIEQTIPTPNLDRLLSNTERSQL